MSSFSSNVISDLNKIIESLADKSIHRSLVLDPQKNFIRSSKLGIVETVRFILGSGPSTLKNELRNFCKDTKISVSSSAMVQSRAKLKENLFYFLLDSLNQKYPYKKTFKGYKLIAVDGSKINIPYNPDDVSTFHNGKRKTDNTQGKGYNQVHLSAAYDVLNSRFIDAMIKGIRQYDERIQMMQLVGRNENDKTIWIADRGYEGANLIENLKQKTKFIIRAKDINGGNGIITGLDIPESELDKDIDLIFTNYNRKEYQKQKSKYKIIQKSQEFDFLNEDTHFYNTTWRILRFKLKNNYEVLITNLERDVFSCEDIKYIYGLRWNIEIAFNYLKHDINVINFKSRKKEFIIQEILAKLVMYNLCSIINTYLESQRKQKMKKKLLHKINFSNAVHLIMDVFFKTKRKGGIPPNLDIQIISDTSPIRKGRSFVRSPHPQNYTASNYRIY